MPKHRRRKNQRRLDSKSIRNSQCRGRQQKQQDDLDPDYEDEDIDEDQDEDSMGSRNLDATTERPGSQPTEQEAQTPIIPDVADGDRGQQHQQPPSIVAAPVAISESAIDDRRSSSDQTFPNDCATEESFKTGSKPSTESAAEPKVAEDEASQNRNSDDAETQPTTAAKSVSDDASTGAAPTDVPQSPQEDTRLRSQSLLESSAAPTRNDECGAGGIGTYVGNVSPRSSPDKAISINQSATICDRTDATTAAEPTTTKAYAVTGNLPICDNVSGATTNVISDLNVPDTTKEMDREEMLSLDKEPKVCNRSKTVSFANPLSLSEAASLLSEKITLFCSDIQADAQQTNVCDMNGNINPSTSGTVKSDDDAPKHASKGCMVDVTHQVISKKSTSQSTDVVSGIATESSDYTEPLTNIVCAVKSNHKAKSPGKHLSLLIETPTNFPHMEISESSSTDSITEKVNISNVPENCEHLENPPTPKRHPIVQEVIATLYPTRVESPKPLRSTRRKAGPLAKSKSLDDDDDFMIQEMSDTSSTGDLTDNQPLVSEASESEADTDTAPIEFDEKLDPRILSIQTLPLENVSETSVEKNFAQQSALPETEAKEEDGSGRNEALDVKARRAKNRAALEMHFFPQFLNPRFLDSIKEENSDTSDLEGRSPTRQRSSSSLGDLEDDVFTSSPTLSERRSSAPSTPKADAVFPKSSLDFTQKHKHLSNLRSPQTGVIREESPCFVVETKLVDVPVAIEESCSEWTTKLVVAASSDAAEVVYIDSTSSSSSDLMELDYTDSTVPSDTNEDDSSETVHIETPTIEATEDANNIFGDPERTPTREMPDVEEIERRRRENAALEEKLLNDLINEHRLSEERWEQTHLKHLDQIAPEATYDHELLVGTSAIQLERTAAIQDLPKAEESFSSVRGGVTSIPFVSEERLSCHPDAGQSAVESETSVHDNINIEFKSEQKASKSRPDFKIGGPCSINMFASLYTHLLNNNSDSVPPKPVSSNEDAENPVFDEHNQERGELVRQDSSGSHCSNQSQNTVINRGPPSQTDLADLDNVPCVSGSPNGFGEVEYINQPDSLRQHCLHTLAHMPHGIEILEELATVSDAINKLTEKQQKQQEFNFRNLQEIKSMPYPRPDLPKIQDLIVPTRPDVAASHAEPVPSPSAKVQSSAPPPPVPSRPRVLLEESWLGVPTEQDPNVFVCLSPSQRDYMNNRSQNYKSRQEPTPDALLDMHRKFIARRGYHELPSEVVNEIDRRKFLTEKLDRVASSPQLRKSPSPPPIPPPPSANLLEDDSEESVLSASIAPQQTPLTSSVARNGDGVTHDDPRDQNSPRLLAIIRDSRQAYSSDKQSVQERVEYQKLANSSQQQPFGSPQHTPNQGQSVPNTERQPPLVPPRSFASDPQVQEPSSTTSTPLSFPTSDMSASTTSSFDNFWSDPFDFSSVDPRKRFSNIESASPFCSQLLRTQPKRFSSVESMTTTSKKRIENGKVVYDVSDTSKEKSTSGDEQSAKTIFSSEPGIREKLAADLKAKLNGGVPNVNPPTHPQTSSAAPKTDQKIHEQESSQTHRSTASTCNQTFENRSKVAADGTPLAQATKQDRFAYDEFRQRAKESAAEKARGEFLERQNYLLKDFDELTKLIKDDLYTGESEANQSQTASTVNSTATSTGTKTADNTSGVGSSKTDLGAGQSGKQDNSVFVRNVPIQIERSVETKSEHFETRKQEETKEHHVHNVPIKIESGPVKASGPIPWPTYQQNELKSRVNSRETEVTKVRTVPIQIESTQNRVADNRPVLDERLSRPEQVNQSTKTVNHTTETINQVTGNVSNQNNHHARERNIPIQIESHINQASTGNLRSPESTSMKGESMHQVFTKEKHEEVTERSIPIHIEGQHGRADQSHSQASTKKDSVDNAGMQKPGEPKERTIPIKVERTIPIQVERPHADQSAFNSLKTENFTAKQESLREQFVKEKQVVKERTIPIQIEKPSGTANVNQGRTEDTFIRKESQSTSTVKQEVKERTIPIQLESTQSDSAESSLGSQPNVKPSHVPRQRQGQPIDRPLSSQDFAEWTRYVENLGASSENITRPLMKEVELCAFGRRPNIRAPRIKESEEFSSRLSQSTSNLSTIGTDRDQFFSSGRIPRPESVAETRSRSPYFCPENIRQTSVPKELHTSHSEYFQQRESELRKEFERLESDRRRLVEEMNEMQQRNRLRKEVFYHGSCRLPTLSEEEAFRQQMHDEWRNKVAEREERRMQKIVKLTGTSTAPEVPSRNTTNASSTSDIGDEFLRRVHERRSKLSMPADSDWESGAESQPTPRPQRMKSPPKVKVIQGQSECDFSNLPAHLREFAEITNQMIEQHYQEEQMSTTEHRTIAASSGVGGGSDTAKKDGIWTPNNKTEASSTPRSALKQTSSTSTSTSSTKGPPPPPPPPVWSPQPSPTPARKEFRPVKFESPVLPRKYTTQHQDSAPVTPPWFNGGNSKPLYNTQSSSCSNLTNTTNYQPGPSQQQQNQQQYLRKSESVGGNISTARPSGAYYFETNRPQIPKDSKPPFVRPNEVLYQVKNEYMSEPETENDRPRKMAQLARRKFDGIGPTTKDGMPIVLRSEVKENNQHQWYKRMYNTLHKAKNDGRFPYKANGYMSEPEPNYDSDYSTMRYHTLDRRRIPSTGSYQEERTYGTMPNPVRSSTGSYKNQPGKIENYIPGRSSVSDKEKKEWWDEVMDIFDGHLEQQKLSSNYTEGYLSRALKEEGYESDSNLVFRKRDAPQFAPLSPIEQKQAYRNVQAGGEPPLQGFRKAAPEKPKDDEDIEYYPITPTLTKIRVHGNTHKQQIPTPPIHQEIICYPITNVTRPLDLFAPFPKNVPSFIPLNPPAPPCRKSSRTNTALKIVSSHYSTSSSTGTSAKPMDGRHEACFRSNYYQRETPANKFGTVTIRRQSKHEPILRSKSAGTVSSSSRLSAVVREEKRPTGSTHVSRKQLVRVRSVSPARFAAKTTDLRKSSPSPVAFGRSISKERMFAEEKRRVEQTLSLTRKSFSASTNILKDPAIKSVEQVKKAVRSSYSTSKPQRSTTSRTSSFMSSVTRRNAAPGQHEQKTLKISVASVSKGHDSRIVRGSKPIPSTSNMTYHSSRHLEQKTPTQSKKVSSTLSLARTNSTFSVDSTGSRKKSTKRPQTIVRSASRDSAPQTISNRLKTKKKSPPKDIVTTSRVLKCLESTRNDGGNSFKAVLRNEINNSIAEQHDSIRSDSFFQNLFLRGRSPETSLGEGPSVQTNSVLEKAQFWNTISARSEPSLRRSSVYLSQKRPVSDSKFLSMESKHHHKSRSLSPSYRKTSPAKRTMQQVLKFDSRYQMSEEESEFGECKPNKTEQLIFKYEQRSSSEPRTRTYLTEVIRPNSPTVIHGRQVIEYSRSVSPLTKEIVRPPTREVRSPSRRRIDSLRESHRTEAKRIIRASSLSSADDRARRKLDATSELSQSTGSLNVIERHASICRHRTSDRFKELNRFYRNLERVGQLERATSSTDLHPIRKEGELIDFDVWKKVRAHEKAEKELTHLVDKLKHDQREKDLLFRPKDISDVKWNKRADSGLRCKEKSVEDLKEAFERKAFGDEIDEDKLVDVESCKDYTPYWRGSSVLDAASNMVVKFNTQPKAASRKRDDPRMFLSNTLISTLSKDQVAKIKNQLSEIYSNSPLGASPKEKCEVKEDYVVTVERPSQATVGSLKVRCNSSLSKEELLGPILKKKEAQIRAMQTEFPDRYVSPPQRPAQSRTFERISQEVKVNRGPELTEVEKKRLSFSISREIQDKVQERSNRNISPSLLARETRGAIAAENAKKSLPDPTASKDMAFVECLLSQHQTQSRDSSLEQRKTVRVRRTSGGESESNTSDISKATVIFKGKSDDGITKKIQYFEEKKAEEPPKTIYHAREYSSPDEEEVLKAIDEKMKGRENEVRLNTKHTELSSSASDFKELFGERTTNFPVPPPPPPPDEHEQSSRCMEKSQYRSSSLTLSDGSSYEMLYRSRSASPATRKFCISYLNAVKSGDVRKMTDKFETLSTGSRVSFFELSPPRRIRSDPELNSHVYREGKVNPHKVTVRDHEAGDVSWITHKFEMKSNASSRGRSRVRKVISPIPRNPWRKEDRLMPHIDIISKTALLKQQMIKCKSPSRTTHVEFLPSGEVERIRSKFESPDRTSLLGQMYTSSPDFRELKDISSYLNASWVAHRYPKQRDNARSPLCPEQGPESVTVKRRVIPARPNSTSPPRTKSMITSILKPYYDIFADQKFDPLIHRPISRYVPTVGDDNSSTKGRNGFILHPLMEPVKFKEQDVEPPPPPPPPIKNMTYNFDTIDQESPRRYVEGDVNIHYKSPIRYEYKDAIPDEELARKQAESMKKLYQEEGRRRKYLQELEDMNSRRHADNFIPTQKSPISLNRYDDFPTDVSPKSPSSVPFSQTVARALYDFYGKAARELSFKKGDLIYLRRQIDKNWLEGEHNAMVGILPINYVEILSKDGSKPVLKKKPSEGQARARFNFRAATSSELSLNKGELVVLTRRVDENWFEGKIANRKGIFPVSYVEVLTNIGAEDNIRANAASNYGSNVTSKPIAAPASRALYSTNNISPTLDQLRASINHEFNHVTNGGQHPNGILRETKTQQKTEVLHIDTNSQPRAYRAIYKYCPQNNDELELLEGDIVHVLEQCDDGWYVGSSERTNHFGTFPGNYVEEL